MIRAARRTTALVALLAAGACGDVTAPAARERAPESAVPTPTPRLSADCDTETGDGCCTETTPWWC